MKKFIGWGLIACGCVVGVYLGVWVAFIGGVIEVIQEIRAPAIDRLNMSLAIARIVFAQFIGIIAGLCFVAPGLAILEK